MVIILNKDFSQDRPVYLGSKMIRNLNLGKLSNQDKVELYNRLNSSEYADYVQGVMEHKKDLKSGYKNLYINMPGDSKQLKSATKTATKVKSGFIKKTNNSMIMPTQYKDVDKVFGMHSIKANVMDPYNNLSVISTSTSIDPD